MKKNVAVIDIEVYNRLKEFHTNMMEGKVAIYDNYNTTYYCSKDGFHEDMVAKVNRLNKKIEILKDENAKLKLSRKLNWVQRLFNW